MSNDETRTQPAQPAQPMSYVVTSGSYDDVTIEAVFTDPALAQTWVDRMHADAQQVSDELRARHRQQPIAIEQRYVIEEVPLDPEYVPLMPPSQRLGDLHRRFSGWAVCMAAKDGAVVSVEIRPALARSRIDETPGGLWVMCFAADEAGAVEIATATYRELTAKRAAQLDEWRASMGAVAR